MAALQGPFQPLPILTFCWEHAMMNLITQLPLTPAVHNVIAMFVDHFSKYMYFVPCSAKITAEKLAHLFICTVV